jgi:hypothetical protein
VRNVSVGPGEKCGSYAGSAYFSFGDPWPCVRSFTDRFSVILSERLGGNRSDLDTTLRKQGEIWRREKKSHLLLGMGQVQVWKRDRDRIERRAGPRRCGGRSAGHFWVTFIYRVTLISSWLHTLLIWHMGFTHYCTIQGSHSQSSSSHTQSCLLKNPTTSSSKRSGHPKNLAQGHSLYSIQVTGRSSWF